MQTDMIETSWEFKQAADCVLRKVIGTLGRTKRTFDFVSRLLYNLLMQVSCCIILTHHGQRFLELIVLGRSIITYWTWILSTRAAQYGAYKRRYVNKFSWAVNRRYHQILFLNHACYISEWNPNESIRSSRSFMDYKHKMFTNSTFFFELRLLYLFDELIKIGIVISRDFINLYWKPHLRFDTLIRKCETSSSICVDDISFKDTYWRAMNSATFRLTHRSVPKYAHETYFRAFN